MVVLDPVVVLDPSDSCPVGFNPLAFKNYHNPSLIADAILAAFKDIFSENWGIRSQDVLSAALLTLVEIENSTDGTMFVPLSEAFSVGEHSS